jgi:hypothetical protein
MASAHGWRNGVACRRKPGAQRNAMWYLKKKAERQRNESVAYQRYRIFGKPQ